MGLNETRKMKELRETTIPSRSKEIEEICGKPIPYDIDWQSLSNDLEGLNLLDNLSCHRVNMALRVICQDDLGKEAVRDGLKAIRLKNVKSKGEIKMSSRAASSRCTAPMRSAATACSATATSAR